MSKTQWFYDRDGRVGGPVSVSELRHLAASGQLLPTDHVRKEDMDRWVKARAVKGLFALAAAEASPAPAPESAEGDTVFDFFGAGRPPASEPEPAPAEAFNPAFDFFGGASQSSTPPPAEVELSSAAPAATRQSTSPRKSKSVPPAASFTTESFPAAAPLAAPEDGGSFRITAAVASPSESRDEDPIPYADFHADVPMAAPVFDEEVPFAAPASAVGIAVLTGPEVALQPDGSAAPTGGTAALSLDGGWLVARGGGEETYLRLGRLEAVALRDRPGAGLVLSVHAGGQAVAVRCDEDAEPARAFLRRVLAAAG